MQLVHAIAAFLDEQRGILALSTLQWYSTRFHWLEPIHTLTLNTITTDDLRTIWQALATRMSPYTMYMIVVAWRRLFNWCVQRGHLARNPAAQLKKPSVPDEPPKAISSASSIRMLNAAQAHSERDYAIVCLLIDSGARVGGLSGLRLGDLELERGRAIVHEKGLGGNRKSRTIHIKPRTVGAIRAWLDMRAVNGKSVFGLASSGIYQMLERTAKRARVCGRFNPHSFRHAFARGLLENGADLATVSQLLGHSDVSVTVRFYARWSDAELHRKHAKFSPLPD
jgi:integrase/recombinase XerD